MPNTITITNKNATATTLRIDGVITAIAGSGSIVIDEGALIRLLADPQGAPRFAASGDLTHTAPAASGGASTSFAAVVDATVQGASTLVPAVPGRSWQTSRTRFAVASSSGSPTAASISVKRGSDVWQGISADATFTPLTSFSGCATNNGDGMSVSVDVAATGGALSVSVQVFGSYV